MKMITAAKAKEQFNNSTLIKFLDKTGDDAVKKSIARGCNGASFSIYDAPTSLSRPATADVAINYYESLGYSASVGSDKKTIYLNW